MILLRVTMNLTILDTSYKKNHTVSICECYSLHIISLRFIYFVDCDMFSFLFNANISLYVYATFYLSIHLSGDVRVVFTGGNCE